MVIAIKVALYFVDNECTPSASLINPIVLAGSVPIASCPDVIDSSLHEYNIS